MIVMTTVIGASLTVMHMHSHMHMHMHMHMRMHSRILEHPHGPVQTHTANAHSSWHEWDLHHQMVPFFFWVLGLSPSFGAPMIHVSYKINEQKPYKRSMSILACGIICTEFDTRNHTQVTNHMQGSATQKEMYVCLWE